MTSYLHTIPDRLAYLGTEANAEIIIDENRVHDDGFGVLYEDRFIRLIKDPVVFPDASKGGYVRILNNTESNGTGGSVIIPMIGDQLVFVRLFRHATRSWEIELPRGFQEPNISEADNVQKETSEELGVDTCGVEKIGILKPNTGLLSSDIAVFVVKLAEMPKVDSVDDMEIESRIIVPSHEIDNFIKNTPVTCSISISALLLARVHGVLA